VGRTRLRAIQEATGAKKQKKHSGEEKMGMHVPTVSHRETRGNGFDGEGRRKKKQQMGLKGELGESERPFL